jgi:hypothetical protein
MIPGFSASGRSGKVFSGAAAPCMDEKLLIFFYVFIRCNGRNVSAAKFSLLEMVRLGYY